MPNETGEIKILGGYHIAYAGGNIMSVRKENKDVKFAYKFYERHKHILDAYKNIEDFVKEEQNRDTQDRVSVNLKNGQTNTTNAEKLAKGAALLLAAINGAVLSEILKEIAATAQEKIAQYDSVLLNLQAEKEKMIRIAEELESIFGRESDNVRQIEDKISDINAQANARREELKNI